MQNVWIHFKLNRLHGPSREAKYHTDITPIKNAESQIVNLHIVCMCVCVCVCAVYEHHSYVLLEFREGREDCKLE
jgi:hypothetical protein